MKTYTEEKRIRPDVLTGCVYLAFAFIMVYSIVCYRIYGENGAFFSALPFSIYIFAYCALVLAVQKAVYIMVRIRARRSQYLNAETNMHRSMNVFVVLSLLIGLLFIGISFITARNLLGSDRGFFQIIIAGAAILFLGPQGVLRGYLQGLGYTKPIAISDLLIALSTFVSGIIAVVVLYNYGLKVNDLFHVSELSAIYGCTGMIFGIFVGTIVGFIQIIVSFFLRKKEISEFVKSGAPRYLDNKNDVLSGIRPLLLLYCAPAFVVFLDQCVYLITTRKNDPESDYMNSYGIYSGRIIPTILLLSILCCIPFIKKWNRVMARIERDELEGACARYKTLMRMFNALVIPVSIFVFVLSETVMTTIFGKSNSLSASLMMPGGIVIFFVSFAIFFSWLLIHMGKSIVLVMDIGIGFAIHVALMIVLCVVLKLGVMGILLSVLLALALYDALSFFFISKMLKYRQDHLKCVLLPVISSAVAGLLVFLLNKLLINLIGDILTFIICVVIFFVSYMLAMIVLRGFSVHELKNIPFGKFFEGVAARLQQDRYYEG